MIAPAVGAAAIAGVGSVIGGITGGKGAQKAAEAQAQSTREQIAAIQQNQARIQGLSQPTIDRGNAAGSLYGNFLGLGGGDQAAQALATYRGSTGYQDLLNTGLGGINSSAYARGIGASGATLKALQAKGMAIADQSAGSWLSGLNNLANMGNSAIGNVAGVATNSTNAINAANQTAADARGNAALVSGANWSNALQNVFNAGASALGGSTRASSYGSSSSLYGPQVGQGPTYGQPGHDQNTGWGIPSWQRFGLFQGAG